MRSSLAVDAVILVREPGEMGVGHLQRVQRVLMLGKLFVQLVRDVDSFLKQTSVGEATLANFGSRFLEGDQKATG